MGTTSRRPVRHGVDGNEHPRLGPADIAQMMRQKESASKRRIAIKMFGKALRRKDRFQPTWDAIGGAPGIVDVMAQLSVRDVRDLCRWLGRTGSAQGARPERRAAMGELVRLLYKDDDDGNQTQKQQQKTHMRRDKRPLQAFYQCILPACNPDVVRDAEQRRKVEWTAWQERVLSLAHREHKERKFLNSILFPRPDDARENVTFKSARELFHSNLLFSEEVLSKLSAAEGARVPKDFLNEFAIPLLERRLIRQRRCADETQYRLLDLVTQCLDMHQKRLGSTLSIADKLTKQIVWCWKEARDDGSVQQRLERYLTRLVRCMDRATPETVATIHASIFIPRQKDSDSYRLFRLVLQHLQGYRFDIEDDSAATLGRLQHLPAQNDRWPAQLFVDMGVENGYKLFEKLERLHPSGDFLTRGYPDTVLRQARSPTDSDRGDCDILRAVLCHRLGARQNEPWLERVRAVVHDRKKKAAQSREAPHRAFWALSALNLCVAAGELGLLHDTIIWARRFTKDSLTVDKIFGEVLSHDMRKLLRAVPCHDSPEAATRAAATVAMVKRDVILANQVILTLMQSAAVAASEPGAASSYGLRSVCSLPARICDFRVRAAKSFRAITQANSVDFEAEVVEGLWKPTIDMLVASEALLRTPAGDVLYHVTSDPIPSGSLLVLGLRDPEPSMLAELAGYLLDQMRSHLGNERLGVQMHKVVEVILKVAHSDQPSVACPLMRDVITGGADTSSWHRHLLTNSFLSKLPAEDAREFLQDIAGAMTDLMREQNSRPWSEGQRQPAIKVTTIKMMAEVLHRNVLIDPSSTCDILISLLAEARHLDARITIVDSLVGAMEDPTCAEGLRTRIMDALERHVVTVAAQLNERRPLSEADWAQDELPEIGEGTPLLDLLVSKAREANLRDGDRRRLAGLVMDALERSADSNARWMAAFLAKNGFVLGKGERLPACPVNPVALISVFRGLTRYVSLPVFQMLRDLVLARHATVPGIKRATEAVRSDRDLFNSNAGKHWLSQFGQSAMQEMEGVYALQRTSEDPGPTQSLGEVGISAIQDLVLEGAKIRIRSGDVEGLYRLVTQLGQRRNHGRVHWEAWRTRCVPIVNDMVTAVESARREAEQADGVAAAPLLLPNTFRLRTAAIVFPYSSPKEEGTATDEALDALADQVSALVELDLAAPLRRRPYHADFVHLRDEMLRAGAGTRPAFLAGLAVKLARLGHGVISASEPPLTTYLRLELAAACLEKAADAREEGVEREARRLVADMKGCQAEGLREIGWTLEAALLSRGHNSWYSEKSE